MLVKSSRRGGSADDTGDLLEHLLRGAGNERVSEIGLSGGLQHALADALAIARDSRDSVWHMSVSPTQTLSEEQWQRVEAVIRDAYGLSEDLPITSVEHAKPHRFPISTTLPPRPAHRHFLWPTTDPVSGKRINPFRHYVLNERIARQLEVEFGHELTKGAHNRAVYHWATTAMSELAEAIDNGGLLDDGLAQQRTSDSERIVAKRQFSDAFGAADAADAAVAAAREDDSPGAAFIQNLRSQGFALAQGDRLVLVALDGSRQPLGAARKSGMKEADLRALLGDELMKLPVITKGDDVIAWLSKNIAHHQIRQLNDICTSKEQQNDDKEACGLENIRFKGNPCRHNWSGNNLGVRCQRPERSSECEPTGSGGRRRRAEQARPIAQPSPRRRGQDRADADDARSDFGTTGENREAPRIINRRRIEQARFINLAASKDISERLKRIKAHACNHELTTEELQELPGHRAIREVCDDRSLRRQRWLAAQMRSAYSTEWLPESVVRHIADIEIRSDGVILTLWGGSRIVDRGDQIDLIGRTDDVSINEIVEAVRRRGWTDVEITGSAEFIAAVSERLEMLVPSIAVRSATTVAKNTTPKPVQNVDDGAVQLTESM